MARPTKTGLDYFPFDVDLFNDQKMQFIKAKHGAKGVLAVIQLYCKIYRNGFFLDWNEDAAVIFSKYESGISKNEVTQVINECLNREIFNKNLFDKYGILTSNGIQKRYFEASKKRKFIKGDFAYLLVNLSNYGLSNGVFSELTPVNPEIIQERKEGKKIGKENKESNEIIEIIETNESDEIIDISESEKTDSFSENTKNNYNSLVDYIKNFLPNVSKMQRQISLPEYDCLRQELKLSNNQIIEILQKMDNHKSLLEKNTSTFLTIKIWHQNELSRGREKSGKKESKLERIYNVTHSALQELLNDEN